VLPGLGQSRAILEQLRQMSLEPSIIWYSSCSRESHHAEDRRLGLIRSSGNFVPSGKLLQEYYLLDLIIVHSTLSSNHQGLGSAIADKEQGEEGARKTSSLPKLPITAAAAASFQ
jgi:hypothetical protein